MGTTGGGRFQDYSGGKKSGGPGPKKPDVKQDLCAKAIGDIELEEVARCDYYRIHKNVPEVGTELTVNTDPVGGRIAVQTRKKEIVGYLPTNLNYLQACMARAYRYAGVVSKSKAKPIPSVSMDLAPLS